MEKRRSGLSTPVAGGAVVVSLVIGLLIGGVALGPVLAGGPRVETVFRTATVTATAAAGLTGEVQIGSLLCLSAVLSSYAENERV
ncbi:MAG: hypothetical protein QXD59_08100, partial [Candidatus Caldarchaeum sp.]